MAERTPPLRIRAADDLTRAQDPATPSDQLATYACDLRLAIRRAAASNPSTPPDVIELLRRGGATKDLAKTAKPAVPMTADEAGSLARLGPWGEQLAAVQAHASESLLSSLATVSRATIRQLVARHPNTPARALEQLLLDAEESVRETAAKHPKIDAALLKLVREAAQKGTRLSQSDLDRLIGLGVWGRVLAGKHPNTEQKTLVRLSQDNDWRVRFSLAEHPEATSEMLEPLFSLGSSRLNTKLARHTNCPAKVLEQLSDEPDLAIRLAVAEHRNTPPPILDALLGDGSEAVRLAAQHNPNTSGDAIELIKKAEAGTPIPDEALARFAEAGPWARRIAASHPSTPPAALHRLAADADPFIREQVAMKEQVPAVLTRLGSDRDLQGHVTPDPTLNENEIREACTLGPWARALAARHPNTSIGLLGELAEDENWKTRRAVARNPKAPDDALKKLSTDEIADVRWSLARRAALPAEAILRLAIDEFAAIRIAIAQHPDTAVDVVAQLANDHDADVRAAASEIKRTRDS